MIVLEDLDREPGKPGEPMKRLMWDCACVCVCVCVCVCTCEKNQSGSQGSF